MDRKLARKNATTTSVAVTELLQKCEMVRQGIKEWTAKLRGSQGH